jgi:hypothetical protein
MLKKLVQWRDAAGRGKLDDGGNDQFGTAPGPSSVPATPFFVGAGSVSRRVLVDVVKSPAKRAQRMSLMGAAAARSLKACPPPPPPSALVGLLAVPVPAVGPNASADVSTMSARPSSSAAWR